MLCRRSEQKVVAIHARHAPRVRRCPGSDAPGRAGSSAPSGSRRLPSRRVATASDRRRPRRRRRCARRHRRRRIDARRGVRGDGALDRSGRSWRTFPGPLLARERAEEVRGGSALARSATCSQKLATRPAMSSRRSLRSGGSVTTMLSACRIRGTDHGSLWTQVAVIAATMRTSTGTGLRASRRAGLRAA